MRNRPSSRRVVGYALAAALMLGTIWLRWRDRILRLGAALGLVFAAHLATIVAQTWVNMSASTSLWATWSLWTTLYQGKVVPLAAWGMVVAMRTECGRPQFHVPPGTADPVR